MIEKLVLELDTYQVVNLREGLLTLRELGCDTGDWLGELLLKTEVPGLDVKPNQTVAEQVAWAGVRFRMGA